jgi:hypothetical protein
MTSPTLLTTYRAVRDLVGDIQHTAAAVDEHFGRFQIYGSEEELALAIAEAEGLAAQVEQLESNLRRCARRAENTRSAETRTGEPAPIHAELSAASVS